MTFSRINIYSMKCSYSYRIHIHLWKNVNAEYIEALVEIHL